MLCFGQVIQLLGAEPGLVHERHEYLLQQVVLSGYHVSGAFADALQLLTRGKSGDIRLEFAGLAQQHQPAYAHLEEFIQITGADGQELDALQQRKFRAQCLVQHALIEFQPGDFAVDEHGVRGACQPVIASFYLALSGVAAGIWALRTRATMWESM